MYKRTSEWRKEGYTCVFMSGVVYLYHPAKATEVRYRPIMGGKWMQEANLEAWSVARDVQTLVWIRQIAAACYCKSVGSTCDFCSTMNSAVEVQHALAA